MNTSFTPETRTFEMSLEAILDFGLLTNAKAAEGHHADMEAARSAGLRGPVAYSLHYAGIVNDMLLHRHGREWAVKGRLAMTFIRPVYASDTLRIEIAAREVQKNEAVAKGELGEQIDVYNQLDEIVAAGTACLHNAHEVNEI